MDDYCVSLKIIVTLVVVLLICRLQARVVVIDLDQPGARFARINIRWLLQSFCYRKGGVFRT